MHWCGRRETEFVGCCAVKILKNQKGWTSSRSRMRRSEILREGHVTAELVRRWQRRSAKQRRAAARPVSDDLDVFAGAPGDAGNQLQGVSGKCHDEGISIDRRTGRESSGEIWAVDAGALVSTRRDGRRPGARDRCRHRVAPRELPTAAEQCRRCAEAQDCTRSAAAGEGGYATRSSARMPSARLGRCTVSMPWSISAVIAA